MKLDQEQDWYSKLRLRIQLAHKNPYLRDRLDEARRRLSIPAGGYRRMSWAMRWVDRHLKSHGRPGLGTNKRSASLSDEQLEWMHYELNRDPMAPLRGEPLPIITAADELLTAFKLPTSIRAPFIGLLLAGRPMPSGSLTTVVVEERPDFYDGQPADQWEVIDRAIDESYWSGVPDDIPGTLVVIKMIVNEYTTKRELEDAWRHVKTIQAPYGQPPNRRRAGTTVQKYKDWLDAYHTHRVEGRPREAVAEEYDVPIDTFRNRVEVLDELFVKPGD